MTGPGSRTAVSTPAWNVWYLESRFVGEQNLPLQRDAPRIIEDVYSGLDAVVGGDLLVTPLNHADRVPVARLAQLVNVIAPIMTEPGGPAWRQTTYFPFATTSRLAQGQALDVRLESPDYPTSRYGEVPLVDAVATYDEASGTTAVFLVNRSLDDEAEVVVDVRALGDVSVRDASSLYDEDLGAANTLEAPDRVGLRPTPSAEITDGLLRLVLPAVSWTAVELG
ncbi:MAG TPA: alpha-L-arabinofuranosidase C-terminal domain-containing protein [Cellulomonas sp.]|nr:alpha-L-arabinofuranosidase C-terminal domain-containing protein [Cellulomonas sp.]